MSKPDPRQRVLIVDDDPINLMFLSDWLKEEYEIACTTSGQEALEIAINDNDIDLILLDVVMPEMDGYEVCNRLKADKRTRDIPVIFITAQTEEGQETRGLHAGAVDYITKPFSLNIVRARIENQLELKAYRDSLEKMVRERTREIEETNRKLKLEIAERKKAETELKTYRDHLEELVEKRTTELSSTNKRLEKEIAEHKITGEDLEKERRRLAIRLSYEEGLARFSSKLVSDEESALVDGLENLLNACRVSRVSFFINQNDPDKGLYMRQYIEVCAANVSSKAQNNTEICMPYNKRWKNELENGFPVTGTIDEFPGSVTQTLKHYNILSILILPVFVEGLWEGFIAFEDTVVRRNWKKDDAILLQTAASMLGAYLFRKRSKTALMESETYLKTIMATIQTGVLITDPESGKIIDANTFAAEMIGYPEEKLVGNDFHRFVCYEEDETGRNKGQPAFGNNDCMLRSHSGEKFHVRQSSRRAKLKNRDYMVQSFLDISDIKQLLRKQEINIDISKKTLFLINGFPERHMPCSQNANLFTDVIYLPCYSEGGDHFFARNLYKNGKDNTRKSVISLKDQSGHEVGCILRSIYTDLIHNAILERSPLLPVQTTVSILNDAVVSSGIFQADDFFTSIIAQIDQKDLNLTFVSAGHPPFILIRDQAIYFLPDILSSGKNFPAGVFPGCKFQEETIPLQIGDRLIFYTDGLTEMTVRNTQRPLKLSMLEEFLQNILVDNPHAGISVIIRLLLEKIVEFSGENVHPDGRNSSTDDVTIIGVEVENDANENEIIITPQNISDLYQKIETLYQELEGGWKRREFRAATPRLKSVLEEGVMNAWRHGNRENPEKTITVRWRFGNDFHLEIIDEGEGFSLDDVPDPTADENLLKPTGRGIYLMKRYSNGIGWSEQGRRMAAFFKKEGKTKMHTGKNHYRFPLWRHVSTG